MFVEITNEPRPYAWGSPTAIAELLGRRPSGGPEAELWLGAHAGSPSVLVDSALASGSEPSDLATWIAADPVATLGAGRDRLPFLLKILAAGRPLSLQAHPTAGQAREGFERENAADIPIDAPHRNYRDPFPKPELIYALSPSFEALCGFRPLEEACDLVQTLIDLDVRGDTPAPAALNYLLGLLSETESPREVFEWLIAGGPRVAALVERVTTVALLAGFASRDSFPEFVGSVALPGSFGFDRELDTVRTLAAQYPGDPGIVISLLLNRVTLRQGEALYLPAGNIHAYLEGLGVELMTASDNVLRGGLTPKHVDAGELLKVLDFSTGPVPYLRPTSPGVGVEVFRPEGAGFALVHVGGDHVDARHELAGPAIAICTAGAISIAGATAAVTVARGQAVYVTPDEAALTFTGAGELFLATT